MGSKQEAKRRISVITHKRMQRCRAPALWPLSKALEISDGYHAQRDWRGHRPSQATQVERKIQNRNQYSKWPLLFPRDLSSLSNHCRGNINDRYNRLNTRNRRYDERDQEGFRAGFASSKSGLPGTASKATACRAGFSGD